MIFGAGAGAMAQAAKAMRKIQQRINDRVAKTRRRATSRNAGTADYSDYEPERTDFPCMELCGTCGYFFDAAEDDTVDTSCPACGEQTWVDLGVEPVAERVRDMEAAERNQVPLWIKISVSVATFLFLVAAAVVLGLYVHARGAALAAASTLFLVPAAWFGLSRPAAVLLLQGRERMPDRWHVPMPLPAEGREPTRVLEAVEAQPVESTLEAPVTGRECVAYQVCVLFDTPGDARPAEWALEEQRAEPLRLGEGLEVEPDELYLESPVEQVHATGGEGPAIDLRESSRETDERYDELKRFLRRRGLFITEGEFHFYEAVLEPGDRLHVADYDGETYVVEHSDAADADELPELPDPSTEPARAA